MRGGLRVRHGRRRSGRTDGGAAAVPGGVRLDGVQFHAVASQLADQIPLGFDDPALFHD